MTSRSHGRTWSLAALVGLAVLATAGFPLHGDVRYELGTHRVSTFSVAETFSHRPIVFRLLTEFHAWLPDQIATAFGQAGSMANAVAFEASYRLIAYLLCAGAGAVLWAGLRTRTTNASAYALAAFAGLALVGRTVGQPDWAAAVLAVSAVGVGLVGTSRGWAVLAGLLLALAALVKIATLPVAVAGLVVIVALDRRRGLVSAIAAFVLGSALLIAIWALAPWEIRWLLDIRSLQPSPFTRAKAQAALTYFAAAAVRWPSVALIPVFFIRANRRERWYGLAVVLLATSAVIIQGQYYGYHAAALVCVSAVMAVHTIARSARLLRFTMAIWILGVGLLFLSPVDWRAEHSGYLFALTLGWVVAVAVAQFRTPRTSPAVGAGGRVWAVVLVVASLLATCTDYSAEALVGNSSDLTVATDRAGFAYGLDTAAQLHDRIGAATPVAYLVFGQSTYIVGNPTQCQYPSALFLQRPNAASLASAQTRGENLACLSNPSAQYLIWDQAWLKPDRAASDVMAAVDANFDCSAAQRYGALTVCPRRGR